MKLKLVEAYFQISTSDEPGLGLLVPCILCKRIYQKTEGSRFYYCNIEKIGNVSIRMRHPSIFRPAAPDDENGCRNFRYKRGALKKLI